MTTMDQNGTYDRAAEVKRFEESKAGVKGLVDLGVTAVPPFFVHPPATLADLRPPVGSRPRPDLIPTVDLSGVDSGSRPAIVAKVREACRKLGFFQVVNHGVPAEVLDRTMASIKGFHEQPAEVKARYYTRQTGTGVSFISNVDLFHSKAASWRDTLQIRLGPTMPDPQHIPEVCRDAVFEWGPHVGRLGELLMELLCEGLGLRAERLKEMTCSDSRLMVGHYYPHCPQPDLTVGIASHTDPGFLTVLMQGEIGGLQVKHETGWVDVEPVPGALVINIGDVLQIMSNDEYKSVEHRVLANPHREPRVSIAVFFNATDRDSWFGPFPELVSSQKPTLFSQFKYADYMRRFFTKELDGKSLVNYYRI